MARAQLDRLIRWGFPAVSIVALGGTQVLVPRLLQLHFSDGEYVAYVTVMAVAAYVGLADAGLQFAITREMSAAHGSADKPRFAAEVRRARRLFLVMGIVGCVVAGLGVLTAYGPASSAWTGASTPSFQLAVTLELLACCGMLSIGGYDAVLYYSTGRLLGSQVAAFCTTVVPALVLLGSLALSRSLTTSLITHALVMLVIVMIRGLHARQIARVETAGVTASEPQNGLLAVLGAGVALKFATILPMAAFPHVLSLTAVQYVPAAVPARTFAGIGRMVVQQFVNLLNVHVTRRIAGGPRGRLEGFAQYRAAAAFLFAVHLIQLGAAAALVEPVFAVWLPMRANEITAFLPGMLMEQAFLAAAMPASILYTAVGRLRVYGIVGSVGVVLGLATFLIALPYAREAAFGYGLAASSFPYYLLGLHGELSPLGDFPSRTPSTVLRYVLGGVAALACLAYATHPRWSSAAIIACGAIMLPRPAMSLWRMFRGVSPLEA
jgi:hypothetical protein